jgi:hypothetical protein
MRVLGIAVVVFVSAFVVTRGVDPLQASAAGSCRQPAVTPTAALWSAARSSFRDAFVRIRRYLITPTTGNQAKMYARVDFALFQFYSWQGGVLNANEGKVSGRFTLEFKTGSQCVVRNTKTISFQVLVRARFTSTNHRGMNFSRLAHVRMKVPRITRYMDRVIR